MPTGAVTWVRSNGGPLVLVEEDVLSNWGGTDGSPSTARRGRASDCDRACAVDGYLGRVPIGNRVAVVFGDAPMETTWQPLLTDGVGGRFVRVQFGPDDNEALRAAEGIASAMFHGGEPPLTVKHSRLRLFDSAYPGTDILNRSLAIDLAIGTYNVETAELWDSDAVGLVVHRLTLVHSTMG